MLVRPMPTREIVSRGLMVKLESMFTSPERCRVKTGRIHDQLVRELTWTLRQLH